MRRRRRRIQYYNAEPTRVRLLDKPWVPFAAIIAAALVVALITGAILGSISRRADRDGITYGDLSEFGGIDASKTYEGLYALKADFIVSRGMTDKALKSALRDLPDGNGAGVWLYDGRGGTWFETALANKTAEKLNILSSFTAEELAETVRKEDRYSVGYFVTGAFEETDEQSRILATAHEMALLSELAAAGVREIVLMGLSADAEHATAVSRYVRQADEVLGETILGVALPAESTDLARLVGATEAFADSYFLDLRALSGKPLADTITKNAYFITCYRTRLMLNEADRESAATVVEGFGLTEYQWMPKGQP